MPVTGTLNMDSSVMAVIPHYRGQKWLAGALASLAGQSRPPDAIVVADDYSARPPTDIVGRFPQVTLVRSSRNVGQYRLIQQILDQTGYGAYLFQDADDWSHPERLETLLRHAEETGAELIGSYESRVFEDGREAVVSYPGEVNRVLAQDPGAFALLLCTALASKALLRRVGGLASGMRICGDYDFILRAHHAGKLENVRQALYFRRIHPDSLTSSADTGFESERRMQLHRDLIARGMVNAALVQSGKPPDLRPYSTSGPVRLALLCGPCLQS